MWLLPRGAAPALPGLPDELQNAVRQITRRSRLWHRERDDVARELAAHFRDGLESLTESGCSREDAIRTLLREFGEPAMLSRMIRTQKRKCRSAAIKLLIRSVKGVCIIMLPIAFYIGWLLLGQIKPNENYLVILNSELQDVAEEDRAWPLYRDTLLGLPDMPKEVYDAKSDIGPGHELWPAAMAWMSANAEAADVFLTAGQRPVLGAPYDNVEALTYLLARAKARGETEKVAQIEEQLEAARKTDNPELVSLLLPALHDTRQGAFLLIFRARQASADGRVDDALRDLSAAHGMGRQLLVRKTLIEQLVGVSIIREANKDVRNVLSSHRNEMTAAQLAALRSDPMFALSPDAFAIFSKGERMVMYDIVQRVFTDDGKGDGVLSVPEYNRFVSMTYAETTDDDDEFEQLFKAASPMLHAGRKETLAKYEEIWSEMSSRMNLPLYTPERRTADEPVQAIADDPWLRVRYALIVKILPSLNRADELMRKAAMNQQATEAAVAMFEYRAATGDWPASLDALVPDYLEAVPADVYDGGPLKYAVEKGDSQRLLLYSVGENFADDRGWDEKIEFDAGSMQPADIVFLSIE